ncbi:MAG: PAS domain S-box protein, partial [Elusimicrobia bacterium]|nr:PAS domain S-box protein [Elusimicrobiota bacterium]
MTETPTLTPLDRRCLEALKTLGKALGQMSLYQIGHPAVAVILAEARGQLSQALAQVSSGELLYSFDGEKLVANGRIIGTAALLPSTIPALFTRFKLASLTFKAGLGEAELAAFCRLAAAKPESEAAKDPAAYLKANGVEHVVFSEAVYAKMSEEALAQAVDERSLGEILGALIGSALSDPARQQHAYERITALLGEDVRRQVDEKIKPLQRENTMLANESARMQGVFGNMVEGVVMVDEQGKVLMMNPAAENIYGTRLSGVAGLHLTAKAGPEHMVTLAAELTTPEDRAINPAVEQTAAAEETRRILKAAGAVVQNQDGKIVGMVSQLSDAAQQKELQRVQRDFVAHVTHELRAPLSSIHAALEILQGEVADRIREEESRILSTALKNTDRLAALISSILDFSKIESGQMRVFPKKDDAETIAREAVDSLSPWAAKKGLSLKLLATLDMPPVLADSQRVVQVLVNLLSNAIKFTPRGGSISVRVQLAPGKTAGGPRFVEFAVSDTGPGIPKKDQERVFEKFIQIAAGEMHVGGTGLGLAIAKALVHLHGGKMWIESEEGHG